MKTPESVFLEHQKFICKVARQAAWRYGLPRQDAEDFEQEVQLKLIENDYARLRAFKGGSSLKTFLRVVIANAALDKCNSLWGKWRPSAKAKRLGREAVWFERLTSQDHRSHEEAIRTILSDPGVQMSREDLETLATQLPRRQGRPGSEQVHDEHRDSRSNAEDEYLDKERARRAQRVRVTVAEARSELDSLDGLIVTLMFIEGFSAARIAEVHDVPQREVYTRKDRALRSMKRALDAKGITWAEVVAFEGWDPPDESDWPDEEIPGPM